MCIGAHVCACMWKYGSQESMLGIFLYCFPLFCLETWSVAELGAHQFIETKQPANFGDLPVFASLELGLQACTNGLAFYVHAGDLNLGPCVYMTSTLPTKPSPWPWVSLSVVNNI